MRGLADIPQDLTDDDKVFIFQFLDAELNSRVLYVLLYGIYTGILAVTLWHIFIDKRRPISRALVVFIILLHALITINVASTWSFIRAAFIDNGQSFWTVYSGLTGVNQAIAWEIGIPSLLCNVLTDLYMIWCCWMVWGRCWLIVLLPILSLISATVLKVMEVYLVHTHAPYGISMVLYVSFILGTSLWCTLFIIFRILTVTGIRGGADSRLGVYRRFIEVLVESSALYSIALILSLAFFIRNDFGWYYLDPIAAIAKGVAPTLLVGRAAAGHTRPNEEYEENATVSTLRFQMSPQSSQPSGPSTSSFQAFTVQSAVLETDIEAQPERLDVFDVSVVNRQ